MKRNKIIIAITGIAILFAAVCSGIIIAQGIRAGSFTIDNRKADPPSAWELEKTELEEFSDISVGLSYCDLSILPGDGYYLEYRMDGICEKPDYKVSNGKFQFQESQTQLKYRTGFHFFFNPGSLSWDDEPFYVNLYVPEDQYFNLLKVSSESGNVEIGNIQAKEIEIHAEYGNLNADSLTGDKISIDADSGKIKLGDIACDNLDITNDYGDVSANSFEASDKAVITLESGNLDLSRLESGRLTLSNEYGNCCIDEITVKNSDITLESGRLELYDAILGNTEINSSYGNVSLDLAGGISDYNYDLDASYGTIKLDGKRIESDEEGEVYYRKDNGQKNNLRINSESGDIEIW